jgi:RNA polymerase sigma factor (sigma-70 family)
LIFSSSNYGKKENYSSKIKYMEDYTAVSQETYELLVSADWETLGKKMLARAIWRGGARYHINCETVFAGGYSIEDVVSHIIKSVFEGGRHWDPNEKSLDEWLLSQVDSVMDWWLNLKENKNIVFEEFENTEQDEYREATKILSTEWETVLTYGLPDPETLAINKIDDEESKTLFHALFDDTSDDPELQEMILVMMEVDEAKPAEIADKLGVSVEDIYNRKKRLKRRLDKIMAAQGKSES